MTKPTKWVCAQRRLGSAWASAQSDQSSLCAQWLAKDPSFLHADSENSDQTGRMPRLISLRWAHTHFVGFVMSRLICPLGFEPCLLVLRAGCGIWLCQFLIIAYLFTLTKVMKEEASGVFLFVCLYVRLFVRTSVLFVEVLHASNSSGVHLTNHSSESIHIWTIGTLEGRLSFHDTSPKGPCPGVGLEVKI